MRGRSARGTLVDSGRRSATVAELLGPAAFGRAIEGPAAEAAGPDSSGPRGRAAITRPRHRVPTTAFRMATID
jgi:hypothetical protein